MPETGNRLPSALGAKWLLLIPAALLLPLLRFGQPLWSDEATSVWLARLPLRTLFLSLCDPHPAGYYLLLRLWLWGGEVEWWLRLPSLLAGVLAALLTYRLALDMGGRAWAGLGALLLVLHPLQVWYAGEVRMYMLSQMLGLLSVWLGWHWLDRASQKRALVWTSLAYWLAMLSAFGADYAALIPFVLTQALWLARGRPRPWFWLSLQASALLAAGALWLRPSQLFALSHSYPTAFLAIILHPLNLGLTPTNLGLILRALLVVFLVGLLAVGWRWSRAKQITQYRAFRWLVTGGWLALLLFATFPRLYSIKRQIMILLPFLAIVTAWVFWSLPRWLRAAMLSISLAITLLLLPQHRREPWDILISDLQSQVQGSSVVWVDELAWAGFDYYTRRQEANNLRQRASPFLGDGSSVQLEHQPTAGADLWLVLYLDLYRDLRNRLSPAFLARYELVEEQRFDGLDVYRYTPRAELETPPIRPELTDREIWGLDLLSPLSTCGSAGSLSQSSSVR